MEHIEAALCPVCRGGVESFTVKVCYPSGFSACAETDGIADSSICAVFAAEPPAAGLDDECVQVVVCFAIRVLLLCHHLALPR